MKKVLALAAATALLLSLCACRGSVDPDSSFDNTSGTTSSDSIVFPDNSSSGSSVTSNSGSFSNDYGTSSTLCAVAGCSNTIAHSGDTNCCIAHSNRCLECSCYIDGDAMYCMDCLEEAILGDDYDDYDDYDYGYDDYDYDYDYDDYDYDYDYDDYDYDYDYDMPESGESFSDYVQRVDPELYNEMEDIFNSLN